MSWITEAIAEINQRHQQCDTKLQQLVPKESFYGYPQERRAFGTVFTVGLISILENLHPLEQRAAWRRNTVYQQTGRSIGLLAVLNHYEKSKLRRLRCRLGYWEDLGVATIL